MNNGAFGENFPYSNFHDLNMDWIIKIAKDFLDQYTHIQEIIENGEQSLQDLTTSGLAQLQDKADNLEALLQAWYDEHSQDIADQLADALADLNEWYNEHSEDIAEELASAISSLQDELSTSIVAFNTAANEKAERTIESIPDDYTELSDTVTRLSLILNAISQMGENLLNNSQSTPDYALNPNNGDWFPIEGFTLYAKRVVTPGDTFYTTLPSAGNLTVNAYPNDPQVSQVGFVNLINSGSGTSFVIPDGCNWMLMSIRSSYTSTADLYQVSCNDEYARTLIEEISEEMNIFDGGGTSGYALDTSDGDWFPISGYFLSSKMRIHPGTSYKTNLPSSADYSINIYQNDPAVSQTGFINITSGGVRSEFIVPEGYIYALMSFKVEYRDTADLCKLTAYDEVARDNMRTIITVDQSSGKYRTLRDGIEYAYNHKNTTVIINAGTYDLLSEFATEIAQATGKVGIALGNNMHLIFHDGAYVTALFDNSQSQYTPTQWRWIYDNFNPFYAEDGDYTIENLNISAKDCRYCVHDEMDGLRTGIHKYINCKMKYTNTHSDINYVQCIGGGMGKHSTIVIDGGYYESDTLYGYAGLTPEESEQPISYHNGYASDCDGSIAIKNVYLADNGYFRFGYYGNSNIISNIEICGCSMGRNILKAPENSSALIDNFNVIQWNNITR